MQIVYHAANSADAQLVRDLLAQEGLQSFVFGGALEGGAGLLPVGGSVRVEVADDQAAEARAIIVQWQAAAVPADEDEYEPADLDFGDDDTPEHVETGNLYKPLNQRKPQASGIGMAGIVFAAIVGGVLGAIATGLAMQPRNDLKAVDYNADGVADERLIFEDERLARIDADRDGNGQVDQVTLIDPRGLPTSIEEDRDFDGTRETMSTFQNGLLASLSADYDSDGVPDFQQTALRGVVQTQEWLDKHGRVIKRDKFLDGRLSTGEIDSDGDGSLDSSRGYDERGEVRDSRPLLAR